MSPNPAARTLKSLITQKIGKRSHEDFGKVAMEMIKKLDKELPSVRSVRGCCRDAEGPDDVIWT